LLDAARVDAEAIAVIRLQIDDTITAIDGFTIANSSHHPTNEMLDDFKRRAEETELRQVRQSGMQEYCESNLARHFRRQNPIKSGCR